MSLSEVPEMMPPEVRRALAEGRGIEEFLSSRSREDERDGRDRRTAADDVKFAERRRGERRNEEDEQLTRLRESKTRLREERARGGSIPVLAAATVSLLVILAVGYGLFTGLPESGSDPDCMAAAAPGVNWQNCRQDGLAAESADLNGANLNNAVKRDARFTGSRLNGGDLRYGDVSGADLSYAELRGARLKGTGLRNADLSYADLSMADLSYADMKGANLGAATLEGARLDRAIWVDGRRCASGSVGDCLSGLRAVRMTRSGSGRS
ncbi:MAG: pentapeptide repeat-containing protein [gamma proteobacterium symbiont of Phacoides pectinatus]